MILFSRYFSSNHEEERKDADSPHKHQKDDDAFSRCTKIRSVAHRVARGTKSRLHFEYNLEDRKRLQICQRNNGCGTNHRSRYDNDERT